MNCAQHKSDSSGSLAREKWVYIIIAGANDSFITLHITEYHQHKEFYALKEHELVSLSHCTQVPCINLTHHCVQPQSKNIQSEQAKVRQPFCSLKIHLLPCNYQQNADILPPNDLRLHKALLPLQSIKYEHSKLTWQVLYIYTK